MSKYIGKPVDVAQPVADVFNKISDIGAYQARLDALPEEIRAKLGDVKFTDEAIVITAAPVGEIRFKVVEKKAPDVVRLEAEQSPVPFGIAIHTNAVDDNTTRVSSELEVDIPAMLRPMVGSKLQEAADKFSELMTAFFAK